MKSWRRTLAIGFIIAITSQLYWNVFVNNFRVSASVILLPVLIMTVGSQIHTMTICTVTSIIVFLFRICHSKRLEFHFMKFHVYSTKSIPLLRWSSNKKN